VAKGSGLSYPPLHRFVAGKTGLALASVDRLCAYLRLRSVEDE
jgi:hypothetical protein